MKNVMITGAGGFAGRNLVEQLSGKYHIYPMRHRDLDLLDAKTVRGFFELHPVDVVLHCAVVGGSRMTNYDENRVDVVEKNLRMFLNLQCALPEHALMIYFGSGAEYSKDFGKSKISESLFGVHIPADAYGFAKYVISRLAASQARITCLRIFGLYGKYEDYRYKFISNAIVKNLLKMPIVINQNVVFDYLYMDDFTKIVERFVECPPGEQFCNISPKESIDLVGVAGIINEVGSFKSEILVLNEGMNSEYTGDNSQLVKELGGYQFLSYKEGISKLYQYYQSVFDTLDLDLIRQDPCLQYCKINSNEKSRVTAD